MTKRLITFPRTPHFARLLLCGAALLSSHVSFAQPAPTPPAPGSIAADADKAYQAGRAFYDLRDWDQAIASFKEAYRLRPDAPSLFNIAQSYRLKGDCAEALGFYKTYRRNFPNEKNIDKVDGFIAEMQTCVKNPPPTTHPDHGTPTTDPTKVESTPPIGGPPVEGAIQQQGDTGRTLRIAGFVVGGVGAASIVAGIVLGVKAQTTSNEVEDLPVWDPSLARRGERQDLGAKIAIGVGGAALITGGVLVFLGYRQTERSSNAVTVVPHHDGGLVVWSGRL